MRTIEVAERRRLLVHRHRLAGDADGPDAATRAVVALHATDPASVYLSVLARSRACTLADISASLYERRSLVRWMAMRRTLFVFSRDDVGVVQAAVSDALAASLRTQLVNRLRRNGAEPPIDGEAADWVDSVAEATVNLLHRKGSATGAELSSQEPTLRTLIPARAPSDRPQLVTTSLLTMLGAQGRIVRGNPTGAWTSRHHRWEPVELWWPGGLRVVPADDARRTLARRWLARFGPATVDDLRWWTGWNQTLTRAALADLRLVEIDRHGTPGIDLADATDDSADASADSPSAALLPALDPTPMGWKHRTWMFDIDAREVFDNSGNIGPTVWWNGAIVGSWAVAADGEIRTVLRADPGADARTAVDRAARDLRERLEGAVVTPAARTPAERALSGDDASE